MTKLYTDITLTSVLIRATTEQAYTLQGHVGKAMKMEVNSMIGAGNRLIKQMNEWAKETPGGEDSFDMLSDFLHEVLRVAIKSEERVKFLAMCKAFAAGEIREEV